MGLLFSEQSLLPGLCRTFHELPESGTDPDIV